MAEHHNGSIDASAVDELEHALDKRLPGHHVQHLGMARSHARPLPGGEHDRNEGAPFWRLPLVSCCVHGLSMRVIPAPDRLPGQDSNLDNHIQSVVSYRWTTGQGSKFDAARGRLSAAQILTDATRSSCSSPRTRMPNRAHCICIGVRLLQRCCLTTRIRAVGAERKNARTGA